VPRLLGDRRTTIAVEVADTPSDGTLPSTIREMGKEDRRRSLALYVLCVGMLMIVLDATIVNVALPTIQKASGSRRTTSRGWSTRT
jgi:hypothetical protein